MSIRIRSGCSARAIATPASASVAVMTVYPADLSRNTAKVMLAGLSSTIRTLDISGGNLARDCPADLRDEALAVEVPFVHDRRHVPVEPEAIIGSNQLRGDDHDGNASGIREFV